MFETKRLVVVAEVPVAFINVKFWRVVDELASMFVKVPRAFEVMLPPLAVVKKRFVEDAVVEKKLVVVAEVPVAVVNVNACRVDEADTNKFPWISNSAPLVVVAVAPITTAAALLG